ncbi:hypothetical protein EKL30_17050 [Candidimonas sp. SYP-B2681]|uniref:S8 family serine peptidase n=1 Tax=Candidimonas sp. SYP-B2681 TaxID=2497686 RepID=UPI000F86052C|nr:S8 family serine peptidase [Candidimonas sp. SYP-B2681]RTZ39964.1 hypothetical protein EKL30_17050 [Candidimonas sp. SYP-B2681]
MKKTSVYIPSDPLFPIQWHLLNLGNTPGSVAGYDINVIPVWRDYTGREVLVGVLDDGMDNTHPDLLANYRSDLAWDVSLNEPGATVRNPSDAHGVAVSGLIAATTGNGIGGVGVAWGSEFTMYRMDLHATDAHKVLSEFQQAAEKKVADGIDISSNSWGPGPLLDQETLSKYHAVGRHMAEAGRDGLGIVALFAGGNDRTTGMNTNYDPTDNSPWGIIVAASHQNGGIASYSTEGASILISAPGSGLGNELDPYNSMVTTDRQSTDGYNRAPGEAGNYTHGFNGTSAATPVAAGVVALMLEANAGLGYRDVQEILAYSAKRATFLNREYDHAFNGARDWNGGALLASHDFGYGHIDALAAVRLAESWMKLGTVSNLVLEQGRVAQHSLTVGAGQQATATASFAPDYRVEQMTVTVDIEADSLDGIVIKLISPNGMVSQLMKTPFNSDDDDHGDDGDDDDDNTTLHYTFNTVLNWGSDLGGEWTLEIGNTADSGTLRLNDWSILAYTAGNVGGGTQIFTDEFARFSDTQSERVMLDAANGTTLNAAAITSSVRFDLANGLSWIGATEITLGDTSGFRHLVSGDGNDTLIGNGAANILMAGRGNNHVDGGAGLDVVRLIGDRSNYGIERHDDVLSVRSKTLSDGGVDVLHNVELLHFTDQVVLARTPVNLGPDLFDEASYLAQNPDVQAAVLTSWLASGFDHYTQWGAAEGRNPNALFDEQGYLATNADVAAAVNGGVLVSGYQHFQAWGWTEGRNPSAWMDTAAYLTENPDVAAAQANPLQHFLLHGVHEGREIVALSADMWA